MAHADVKGFEAGELAARLAQYVGGKLGALTTVSSVEAISGGASRMTYRFQAETGSSGVTQAHRLILRLDPAASLIETDRTTEFAALQTFFKPGHASRVPVPEPLWLENDAGPLGAPFFIMAEVTDGEANPIRLMQKPYAAHHAAIGAQMWSTLGEIARTQVTGSALAPLLPVPSPDPAACWRRELDRWVQVIDADELEPQPVTRAAIRWLVRHPPPPAQRISIVHGDYRMGNVLIDRQGGLRAVLDWEMVHLGDPLEDLAWGLNRVWCFNGDARVGGLLAKSEAIAHWQRASGLEAEAHSLHWWEVFSCVKGQAIWLSAARAFQSGDNRDSIMAMAAWMQGNGQDRATLELLGHLRTQPVGEAP